MPKTKNQEVYLYKPSIPRENAANVLFCFPGDYEIAMSSLGYTSIFKWLDESEAINVQRVYGNSKKINATQTDVVCFSMTFELAFAKIFAMIEQMGIPLYTDQRSNHNPLVIAGGVGIAANPEPFADFFDVILLGDAEELLVHFIASYKALPETMSRQEKLLTLSTLQGVYVPSLYEVFYKTDDTIQALQPKFFQVPQIITKNNDDQLSEFTYTPILVPNTVFGNKFIVEVVRGCNKRCRFCLASYLTLPTRYYNLEKLKHILDFGLAHTNNLALLGALITEHPQFDELCDYIRFKKQSQNISLSVSSLRVDALTTSLASLLADCHLEQVTLAIEAGSDRLKRIINKQLTNEQIFKAFETAQQNGLKSIKLYGMIGLPYEVDEDIEALLDLLHALQKQNKNLKIVLGLSNFVPKAHTPFQWVPLSSEKQLTERLKKLEKGLRGKIELRKPSLKWDFYQALLARGDRRLAPLLERVYRLGCTLGSWRRAYKELLSEGLYIPEMLWYAKRERLPSEILPWQHLQQSIPHELMIKDFEHAQKRASES